MAIKSVQVKINDTWYDLTAEAGSDTYTATINAPGATSANLEGGYYPMTLRATTVGGTVKDITSTDTTFGNKLRLVVYENIPPVITLETPTNGAFLGTNSPQIIFTVTDEAGGSGVNSSSITVNLDATPVEDISKTSITNGYRCTVNTENLSDGSHTLEITASDIDGNEAVKQSITFTIDTTPPVLDVTLPQDGFVTNQSSVYVTGYTNDALSSPVTVKITTTEEYTPTIEEDGSFNIYVGGFVEGENTIIITATDKAGQTSTVVRQIIIDSTEPEFVSVTVEPNPTNVQDLVNIIVEVV